MFIALDMQISTNLSYLVFGTIEEVIWMLTKDQIKEKLATDASWTPDDSASDEEWDMFYSVQDEMTVDDEETMEESGSSDAPVAMSDDDDDDDDWDDDDWDDDDDDDDWDDDDDDDWDDEE